MSGLGAAAGAAQGSWIANQVGGNDGKTIATIVGLLGGMWLDSHFGTTPWLMLLFLVFGLVAGFRNVLRAVARAERAADLEDKENGLG